MVSLFFTSLHQLSTIVQLHFVTIIADKTEPLLQGIHTGSQKIQRIHTGLNTLPWSVVCTFHALEIFHPYWLCKIVFWSNRFRKLLALRNYNYVISNMFISCV